MVENFRKFLDLCNAPQPDAPRIAVGEAGFSLLQDFLNGVDVHSS